MGSKLKPCPRCSSRHSLDPLVMHSNTIDCGYRASPVVLMTELEPCPCCAGRADLREQKASRWKVGCASCGMTSGTRRTRAEAIAAWSRRAELAGLRAEVDVAMRQVREGDDARAVLKAEVARLEEEVAAEHAKIRALAKALGAFTGPSHTECAHDLCSKRKAADAALMLCRGEV